MKKTYPSLDESAKGKTVLQVNLTFISEGRDWANERDGRSNERDGPSLLLEISNERDGTVSFL
jgi:hypothetical protein